MDGNKEAIIIINLPEAIPIKKNGFTIQQTLTTNISLERKGDLLFPSTSMMEC